MRLDICSMLDYKTNRVLLRSLACYLRCLRLACVDEVTLSHVKKFVKHLLCCYKCALKKGMRI